MMTTKLKLRIWPDKILAKKCKKVNKVDQRVRDLLGQMHRCMVEANGIGLAANQVGLDEALVVASIGEKTFKLINPQIISQEGEVVFQEGCLSFPGLEIKVKRAENVVVKALDEQGLPVEIEAKGVAAVVFQHEIDHINGVVFIQRLSLFGRIKNAFSYRKLKK